MRRLALLAALAALPAAAQDAARGRLLYETHCLACHYRQVHERPAERSRVRTLADLRDEVAQRAALTAQPFSLEDLEDITEYLNRSYYRLAR